MPETGNPSILGKDFTQASSNVCAHTQAQTPWQNRREGNHCDPLLATAQEATGQKEEPHSAIQWTAWAPKLTLKRSDTGSGSRHAFGAAVDEGGNRVKRFRGFRGPHSAHFKPGQLHVDLSHAFGMAD